MTFLLLRHPFSYSLLPYSFVFISVSTQPHFSFCTYYRVVLLVFLLLPFFISSFLMTFTYLLVHFLFVSIVLLRFLCAYVSVFADFRDSSKSFYFSWSLDRRDLKFISYLCLTKRLLLDYQRRLILTRFH